MAEEALTMSRSEESENGARVLTLNGPLVLRTLFEFQDAVREENPHNLILDLTGVEYMDSAGLGAILGAYASYERKGKKLALSGVNARIQVLLQVTHTNQFLRVYPSVADAIAATR